MPTPTVITDLSQTAASNFPDGGQSPSILDDVQRALSAFVAQIRDGKGLSNSVSLASSATTDIGGQNSFVVEISGTTTITSFGTSYYGPRFLRFTGALTLTHSSSLYLPGAANITTVAGDTCIAVPNQGSSGWNVIAYQPVLYTPGLAITQTAGDSTTKMATTAFVTTAVDALKDVSANSQSTSYTLVLTDRGKSIDFTGAAGQTITIPANASVAFPVGSVVTITNTTANNLSIAITTDTMRQAGTANTGTRTLSQYGVATARKVASTTWIISGSGMT